MQVSIITVQVSIITVQVSIITVQVSIITVQVVYKITLILTKEWDIISTDCANATSVNMSKTKLNDIS